MNTHTSSITESEKNLVLELQFKITIQKVTGPFLSDQMFIFEDFYCSYTMQYTIFK